MSQLLYLKGGIYVGYIWDIRGIYAKLVWIFHETCITLIRIIIVVNN